MFPHELMLISYSFLLQGILTSYTTMEWMVVNPLQIHSTFASLGVQVGDTYCMNEDCFGEYTQ